ISLLLMPKLKDRHSDKLLLSIINYYWPLLNFFGINDEMNLYSRHQNLKEKIVNDKLEQLNKFKIELTSNLKITKNIDKKEFTIQPKNTPIQPEEYYNITITNKSKVNRILSIRSIYNNPKGRGIFSLILDNKEIDIVDAYRNEYLIFKPNESKDINFSVKKERKRESWLGAATVILGV